jgi:hypothetical protein
MNRRAFILGSAVGLGAAPPAFAQAGQLTVIYVGGRDCPNCAQWKSRYKAKWEASPESKKVKWVVVDPPSLRDAYNAGNWPAEQKPILDRLKSKSGTPRFVLVKGGEIIDSKAGVNSWETIYGEIKVNA